MLSTGGEDKIMGRENYSRFLNRVSANRQYAPLRNLSVIMAAAPPGTVFMAGGRPNEDTFPFSKVTVELKDGSSYAVEGDLLTSALQYQYSSGYIPLSKRLKDLQTRVHNLPSDFWESNELLVTTGSQDGLCRAFEMCLSPGDPVIFQEPAYTGAICIVRPYNPRFIAAVEDEFGVCPRKLREALQAEGSPEEIRSRCSGVPKMLYINPVGANPGGTSISAERKRDIYKIACEYDLLILEDDPYFFVQFEEETPVSFMSLDTEGRVLRFDSFSKILSAGLRLGFVTGPKQLVERIEFHLQVSIMHSSALPQVMVEQLLARWGDEGLDSHIRYIRDFYRGQRDAMIAAAEKYLKGLAEWTVPLGGLFLWIRVLGVADTCRMVEEGGLAHGVLMMPGHNFMLDDSQPSPFIRASYSTASLQEIDLGFLRLANLIREEKAKISK